MMVFKPCLAVGILFVSFICLTTENRIRHQKFEEDIDPFLSEETGPETINNDIIDLDDTEFDGSTTDKKSSKTSEDTREPGVITKRNKKKRYFEDDSDEVILLDNDILSPIPLVEDTNKNGVVNVTIPFNSSDDEDLSSGSGSGDIVIEIEDGNELENSTLPIVEGVLYTNQSDDTTAESLEDAEILLSGKHFYEYDSEDVEYIENTTDTVKVAEPLSDVPQYCKEVFNITWSPWSPWIQAGNVDIRFRTCPTDHGYKANAQTCEGDHIEVRQCSKSDERTCRTPGGEITEEYHTQCAGVHIDDFTNADGLWDHTRTHEHCQYTLYDLTYNMAIGNPLNSLELQSADVKMWCFNDDKFVPFYTPTERCHNILKAFCKESTRCKYDKSVKKFRKYKGDLHKRCWTDFVLGGLLPVGFPLRNGQQMICQRFDKTGKFGKMFGHRDSQFATMYDTKQRVPVYSMVTVRSLGDDKWPSLPYMIDRGLLMEEDNFAVWFFKENKMGITTIAELTNTCEETSCHHGEKQALPRDYDMSGYRIGPLLTPDIIGWELSRRVSAFTMTNTAPMEATVYLAWKRVMEVIRKFAINDCHIPVNADNHNKNKPHNGYELAVLYLISGAASSAESHVEVIGNDVTVPEMYWISACCAHGASVSSFGVYVKNSFEQRPEVVSVEELELLLQANYNTDLEKITLYPAFDGVCSAVENDISFKIYLN